MADKAFYHQAYNLISDWAKTDGWTPPPLTRLMELFAAEHQAGRAEQREIDVKVVETEADKDPLIATRDEKLHLAELIRNSTQ